MYQEAQPVISCLSMDCPERDSGNPCWNDPNSPVYKRVQEAVLAERARCIELIENMEDGRSSQISFFKKDVIAALQPHEQ